MKTKPKKGITPHQRVALIAKETWTTLTAHNAIDEPFDCWRKREALETVGCRISEANREQLDRLETHFEALAGKQAKALDRELSGGGKAVRQRFVIGQLATRLGLPKDYGATLAPEQLRGTIINLNTRLKAAKKARQNHE